jgi:hypothetical protein
MHTDAAHKSSLTGDTLDSALRIWAQVAAADPGMKHGAQCRLVHNRLRAKYISVSYDKLYRKMSALENKGHVDSSQPKQDRLTDGSDALLALTAAWSHLTATRPELKVQQVAALVCIDLQRMGYKVSEAGVYRKISALKTHAKHQNLYPSWTWRPQSSSVLCTTRPTSHAPAATSCGSTRTC